MSYHNTGCEQRGYRSLQDEEVVHLSNMGDPYATETLVDRYRVLVESKAKTYFVQGAERDDVIQEGMIGLCKAIRDYREDRENRFRSFAELCVTRQIISAVKAATRNKHLPLNMSAAILINGDEGLEEFSVEQIADIQAHNPETIVLGDQIPADFMVQVSERLSELELHVLNSYLDGKTYQEIGDELHCHTKSIDNALQRVKRKVHGVIN